MRCIVPVELCLSPTTIPATTPVTTAFSVGSIALCAVPSLQRAQDLDGGVGGVMVWARNGVVEGELLGQR